MTNGRMTLALGQSSGGIGAHVAALTVGLIERGWRVEVAGPAATDELFGFADAGAHFLDLGSARGPGLPVAAMRLRHTTGELVHAHGLSAGLAAALSGREPLVVSWHNAVLPTARSRRTVLAAGERVVARAATVTLAASADLAVRARELGARDVRTAPVALPIRRPARSVEQVRAELEIEGRRLVVVVGRLHPQKAHDIVIRAATGWRETEVVIAGDGPAHDQLTALRDELRSPVRLLGRRTDVPDLVAAADVVVLASRWEARALVAQEALLAGRPLVATAVGGLPELLGDGAVLVPPADVQALRQAVLRLLDDPVTADALARRGRLRAAEWPTAADTLDQLEATYRELLGR